MIGPNWIRCWRRRAGDSRLRAKSRLGHAGSHLRGESSDAIRRTRGLNEPTDPGFPPSRAAARTTARAVRIVGPTPRVDGAMEEAVWATAIPITDFVAKLPVEGEEPSVKTEVRILYD